MSNFAFLTTDWPDLADGVVYITDTNNFAAMNKGYTSVVKALPARATVKTGLVADGAPLQRFHLRGPLFVTLSILTFAVAIRPLGLIVSAFISFMVAALGSHETRWIEALIVGVLITAFCSFLFPYALGLPFQLLPKFLQ